MPCAFQMHHHSSAASGCQFAVAEEALIEFDGKMWCVFHLPLSAGEAESGKARWDEEQIGLFNDEIFGRIDEAKSRDGVANLSGIVFPAKISFEHYRGEEKSLPSMQLWGARFGGDAWFHEATFSDDAAFGGATFVGRVSFARARFGGGAWFHEATFDGEAAFHEARFDDYAEFVRARFRGRDTFRGAWFNHGAGFEEATFDSLARFKNARFKQRVTFNGGKFDGGADFRDAEFDGDAEFFGDPTREGRDMFRRSVTFRRAQFKQRAVFTNRRFLDNTDFRSAIFAIAPEFHNCTLHQGTDFSGAQFLDRKGTDEVDAASAYRTLKLAMAGVRSTDEEARFYGLEQQSLCAKPDTPRSVKLFSQLYEMTADYGQSLALPVFWLFFAFFLFFLLYAWVGGPVMWPDCGSIWRFALQQVFQPFSAFRTGAVAPGSAGQVVPLGLAFLAAVHSILTLSFLALFLLALRRRFRLN